MTVAVRNSRCIPITPDLRRRVVSYRQAGLCVSDIAARLGMHRSSEICAIQMICDTVGRRYMSGDLGVLPPVHRRAGAAS